MAGLDWLTARPIAHRGLHGAGAVENTPTAFTATIAAGYAIETDLQITADGEAVVHHDAKLGRLTEGSGTLAAMTAAELKRVAFKETADRIITLSELLDLVAGRATLAIELKSLGDGDDRLPRRAAQVLAGYAGPAALMSFDPFQMAVVREAVPARTHGLIAERWRGPAGEALGTRRRRAASYLANVARARPQFLAYSVKDLPALPPLLARYVLGGPVLTWTVRTEADRAKAAKWADQVIFEGWRP
ncbi:MAG: glycerophosphodiester phosphodiesterase [Bradyrhizobiaceae bacterium]|nr:glycerophosphodiester phosphodiesterase [Hyphomicrobiales bacterium]MBV9427570.1 glycerophosphodiester phosphodiesterase [Bradyrhizobiaceae bacterium]